MKAKLKVINNWEFEEFELTGTSFKYSPTGCKGMVARSEDEIVFWTYHLAQKCSGVLWVKGEVSRWIPSPEPKEQQDVWEVPVLLSCDRGILLVCPASKSLWWMPQMDGGSEIYTQLCPFWDGEDGAFDLNTITEAELRQFPNLKHMTLMSSKPEQVLPVLERCGIKVDLL